MKKVVALLVIVLLGITLVGCSSPKVIPDVIGMTPDEAEEVLKDAGFYSVRLEDAEGNFALTSTSIEVLSQSPDAGAEAKSSEKIILVVRTNQDASQEEADAAQKERDEKAVEKEEIESTLEALEGKSVLDAEAVVTSLGFTAEYKHSNSGLDYTEEISSESDKSRWMIVECKKIDIDQKKITLIINTFENVQNEEANAALVSALNEKLSSGHAWQAVEAYGVLLYPYGFKLHYIVGVLALEAEDENTWYMKATCDVTNEYGATMKDLACEAHVTGTSDNPEVVDFTVY